MGFYKKNRFLHYSSLSPVPFFLFALSSFAFTFSCFSFPTLYFSFFPFLIFLALVCFFFFFAYFSVCAFFLFLFFVFRFVLNAIVILSFFSLFLYFYFFFTSFFFSFWVLNQLEARVSGRGEELTYLLNVNSEKNSPNQCG